MNAITFDTLQFANRLKSVGFTDEQAEMLTELQRTATDSTLEQARHDYHLDDVATKRDLKELETALKHDIELLRADTGRMIAETNQRIAETKAELIRWVVGAGLLQTSLIIGALMKIAHLI
ncbi:MAG: DUF1640 domain-containing protein [Methylococcaceae bacterium]